MKQTRLLQILLFLLVSANVNCLAQQNRSVANVHYNKGVIAYTNNEIDNALGYFLISMQYYTDPRTFLNISFMYYLKQEYKLSSEYAEKAINTYPPLGPNKQQAALNIYTKSILKITDKSNNEYDTRITVRVEGGFDRYDTEGLIGYHPGTFLSLTQCTIYNRTHFTFSFAVYYDYLHQQGQNGWIDYTVKPGEFVPIELNGYSTSIIEIGSGQGAQRFNIKEGKTYSITYNQSFSVYEIHEE